MLGCILSDFVGSLLSKPESSGSSRPFGVFFFLSFNGKNVGLLESKWRFKRISLLFQNINVLLYELFYLGL